MPHRGLALLVGGAMIGYGTSLLCKRTQFSANLLKKREHPRRVAPAAIGEPSH
jgi:hypothetical protein